jgi:hypothetical protein
MAACPTGKHAVSGGYEALNGGIFLTPVASYPVAPTIWRVDLRNTGTSAVSNVQLRVYVICVNN